MGANNAIINNGTIDSRVDTLYFNNGYIQNSGQTFLSGTLITGPSSSQIVINGGSIIGYGSIGIDVVSSGVIIPQDDNPISRLNFNRMFSQNPAGTTSMQIGQNTGITVFDRIVITSDANLAGTLELSIWNGYIPSIGETFEIITASNIIGEFDSVTGVSITPDRQFSVAYGATSVIVEVVAVEVNVVANDDTDSTNEDTEVTIDVLSNDTASDIASLSVTNITDPANGVAIVNPDNTVTYTPDENFNGADNFTYTISDGNSGSDTATVNVTVNPVNDDPVAVLDEFETDEDTQILIAVLANDTDVDGDTLGIQNFTQGANGSVALLGDSLRYTPNANYFGSDTFTYLVSDGTISVEGTVIVTVIPINDAPLAVDDSFDTDEDVELNGEVLGNDSDIEGDSLTAVLETDVSNGSLTLNANGTFAYMPNLDFVGTDSFTYHVNDGQDNSDNVATVSIDVLDTTAPVISLQGDNPQVIVVGSAYVELAATATDNVDGDLTPSILIDATAVDTSTVGSYEVSYSVSDSSDNTGTATRTVNVVAGGTPVLTLLGDNPQTVNVGEAYVEAGATASDAEDGDLTASISIDDSALNTNVVGSYEVSYSVTDSSGNTGTAVRTVNVLDTTAPVISLQGDNPQVIVVGSAYVELAATATDNVDGDLTPSILIDATAVDTSTVGSYEVSYSVTDSSDNTGTATRTVNVVAGGTPVLTLLGDNPQTVNVGEAYVEAGATASDAEDGDLTASISIDDSALNTNVVGSYEVSYSVTDSSGNTGTAVRTVNIAEDVNTAPDVSVNSSYVSGNEGGTLFNTINVSDNEGDTITVISDIGSVIPQIGGTWLWQLNIPDGDIAPTVVTITATDSQGASSNTTFEYEVFNVAPTATFSNIFDEPVFQGASTILAFTNSTDASPVDVASGFDYAVICDSNSTDTQIGSQTNYTCSYPVAGIYTAIGMIRDKDGGISTYSVTIEVLSPSDATEYIEDIIDDLLTNDVLSNDDANALTQKLNNIQSRIERGQTRSALNQLNAFINQVTSLVADGTLSEAQGNNLIGQAQRLISSIMSS